MFTGKPRLGIFEDNSIDRFIYERTLEQLPFPVEFYIFETPAKGLSFFSANTTDIVFLNIHFWGTNYGYQIFRDLRERCVNNPAFIATTALLQEKDHERAIKNGFAYATEKPALFQKLDMIITFYTSREYRHQNNGR